MPGHDRVGDRRRAGPRTSSRACPDQHAGKRPELVQAFTGMRSGQEHAFATTGHLRATGFPGARREEDVAVLPAVARPGEIRGASPHRHHADRQDRPGMSRFPAPAAASRADLTQPRTTLAPHRAREERPRQQLCPPPGGPGHRAAPATGRHTGTGHKTRGHIRQPKALARHDCHLRQEATRPSSAPNRIPLRPMPGTTTRHRASRHARNRGHVGGLKWLFPDQSCPFDKSNTADQRIRDPGRPISG
jgi:hypothetical protein